MKILHSFQYDDIKYRVVRYEEDDFNFKYGEYALEREVRPDVFSIWTGELGFNPLLYTIIQLLDNGNKN